MYGIALPAPRLEDPLQALETAHRRIETQLAALESLPGHLAEHGTDATARETARFALRYFETSGAYHQRDEDEDLFPLLRRHAGEENRAEISAVINDLLADHATMAVQWRRLRALLLAIAQGEEPRLAAADVAGYAWLHRRHMEKEAGVILPYAKEVLTRAELAALAARMAARRHPGA